MTSTDIVHGGTVQWEGGHTWYQVVGELGRPGAGAPVVICHGGPGLTHDYLISVAELARSGRACVLYDQLGNGRSERRPDAPAEFWTPRLFQRELRALVEHLGIAGSFHLFGHSWGGMLALEAAADDPSGLRSLVVASAFASAATYTEQVGRLVRELPTDLRDAIGRHEAAGSTDSLEYQQAVRAFYLTHVCRCRPVPDEVLRTLSALGQDSTVYQAMCGPSEFSLTGSLRDWNITDRLADITLPVLLISGRHDEVTPQAVEPLHRGLPDARWELFAGSSHMAHVEEPERFLAVIEGFLAEVEKD